MIPASMTGGWVRKGITIGDAARVERDVVWWLQSPSKHCDLRVPLRVPFGPEEVMCFAGTTSWDDSSLTWSPEIELHRSLQVDTGVITWDGQDMIESGFFDDAGSRVSYVERWQRLPGSNGDLLALSLFSGSTTGRLVRAGTRALTIVDARPNGGPFAAVAWSLRTASGQASRWVVHHRWPADAVAPAPPLAIADDTRAVVLSDNSEWCVDEHWRIDQHREVASISG